METKDSFSKSSKFFSIKTEGEFISTFICYLDKYKFWLLGVAILGILVKLV